MTLTRAPEVLAAEMTRAEAEEAANKIRRGVGELRRLLVEFKEREGWRALGYSGLEECCRAEFNIGHSHLFRQLRAADVEKNVGSPLGTERESHLRPLAGKPPEVQQQAWAASEEDGSRSAASVRRAVEKVEGEQEPPNPATDPGRAQPDDYAKPGRVYATQEPERARGADTGAGSAGAEASLRDAGAEEGKTKAAGFVYTMDPGLDDWTVTPIERKAIQRNGDTLGSVLAFYHLAVAAATDESGGVARQRIMRTLLKQARQRSE